MPTSCSNTSCKYCQQSQLCVLNDTHVNHKGTCTSYRDKHRTESEILQECHIKIRKQLFDVRSIENPEADLGQLITLLIEAEGAISEIRGCDEPY